MTKLIMESNKHKEMLAFNTSIAKYLTENRQDIVLDNTIKVSNKSVENVYHKKLKTKVKFYINKR